MASSCNHPIDLAKEYASMSLRDDEEVEFSIEEGDSSDTLVETPFILLGKLLTEKSTRFNYLKDTMATVWRPKRGMIAREISTNLFLFYFVHELDIRKVLNEGPWSYEQSPLFLKQIEPNTSPHGIQLTHADLWVQAYNIPQSMQTKKIAEMIGAFFGSFITADTEKLEGLWKDFMRVRVQLYVSKPLKRKMKVKPPKGDSFYIEFKYERLPTFCFICGLIGHNEKSCDILFDSNPGSVERFYSPDLRATGRRSQPCAGQQWMLPELPRRKTEGETQKHTFNPDISSEQTDIPLEETTFQKDQSVPQSSVP
ncbi:PREDICTED: uncharacterized protein LOC109179941 [Ipomoea nil]|uniref:uncharacterized protein LOC109179941 n=1 Tax=Ipomoea nil TaxID=35883 RepID=UPI00090107B6|nr:PREDICTED: uncharacterized protein LOC109179941 [Ipomoea nil]